MAKRIVFDLQIMFHLQLFMKLFIHALCFSRYPLVKDLRRDGEPREKSESGPGDKRLTFCSRGSRRNDEISPQTTMHSGNSTRCPNPSLLNRRLASALRARSTHFCWKSLMSFLALLYFFSSAWYCACASFRCSLTVWQRVCASIQ